jgi:vanillate O-demethylase monooxygenase subunit
MCRKSDGIAVAVGGRCPHRFAPLAMGRVVDDCIECPYHGLRFNDDGACQHNPHGDGAIPDMHDVAEQPGWHTIRGYLRVNAHYELLTHNLMDLSHLPFLHPFLSNSGPLPADRPPAHPRA